MASAQIDKILKIYKAIAANSSLTTAQIVRISENGLVVRSTWLQRNLERRMSQKFLKDHILQSDLQVVSDSVPIDITSELASILSEDEQLRAVLRSASIENTTKQFIEIWDKQHLVKNYDLSALDVHGDVYTDSEFGTFQWSPDTTKLLYIAEKKLPKTEPFYKQKPQDKKDKEKKDEDEVLRGTEYLYKPHWGEQLVGKHRPVVAVLDTITDTITVLPGIADDLSPGQVVWTPDGSGVIGIALKHEPRYLGLVACTNRQSWIFLLKNGEYRNLSSNGCAVHGPSFSSDGKHLVWLERQSGGPHHDAHRIMHLKWESAIGKPEVLVDVVRTSKTINFGKPFYGLFNRGFARRCWSSDSSYLFFSTPQRSNVRSYVVNIDTKVLTEIENDSTSLTVLDVKNDLVLFRQTSLLLPPTLLIGIFDKQTLGQITRKRVTTPLDVPGFENLKYEAIEHTYDNNDSVKDFNSMYFGPKFGPDKSHPLVVVPHGGPHASFSNLFSLDYSIFALLGFGVLQVNYRGSAGMGADNIAYLQGKVGDADVKDCAKATQEALKKYPWLSESRIGLSGGSHGGFLVAHLSGQYSDQYKAVAMRNAVIDIAAMFTISDIPDCRNSLTSDEKIAYRHDVCAAEVGFSYDETASRMDSPESSEMFLKMFKASPIIHVDKVKAPTLVCIGTNDLRVPSSQGKHWYHRLKANGVKTKMLVYDDNHPLASGPVEIDDVINVAIWLLEHTAEKEDVNSIGAETSPSTD